jgi:uncharacterized protein (DUF736 family)
MPAVFPFRRIGYLKTDPHGYSGWVATLLNPDGAPLVLRAPPEPLPGDAAEVSFTGKIGRSQNVFAWSIYSDEFSEEFLSIAVDDPALPKPMALIGVQTGACEWELLWIRNDYDPQTRFDLIRLAQSRADEYA